MEPQRGQRDPALNEAEAKLEPYEFRFEFTALEWLRLLWPALVTWGFLSTVLGLAIGMAGVKFGWWSLLLLPVVAPLWWWFGGGQLISILAMIVRWRHKATVKLVSRNVFWASCDDGASWTPFDAPTFEEHGDSWLAWGGMGRMQMVIPKRCLAADDVNAIRSRMNVRGMATTATVE